MNVGSTRPYIPSPEWEAPGCSRHSHTMVSSLILMFLFLALPMLVIAYPMMRLQKWIFNLSKSPYPLAALLVAQLGGFGLVIFSLMSLFQAGTADGSIDGPSGFMTAALLSTAS